MRGSFLDSNLWPLQTADHVYTRAYKQAHTHTHVCAHIRATDSKDKPPGTEARFYHSAILRSQFA